MRKIVLAIGAVVLLAVSSTPIYAEDSASSKHHIELSVSDGMSIIRKELQTGEPSVLHHETLANFQNGGYNGRNLSLFPMSIGYYYQVLPWLQVGGELSAYTNSLINAYDPISSNRIFNYTNTSLYLTAGVRFTYYQTPFVQLYSGLSLGVRMNIESKTSTLPFDSFAPTIGNVGVAFQATAFGVRFGKQVYGFAELGCGYKGILSIGIGTRF